MGRPGHAASHDHPGDFEVPRPRVEPTLRWIRVRAGGRLLADTRRALLLVWFGPGRLPTYCIPAADVDLGALHPEDGAVRLDELAPGVPELEGYWTFPWGGPVRWFEEALEVHVHARDPRKRVDAIPSERHVRVSVDGVVMADSRRPTAVFETDLPVRWYLPPDDVSAAALVPSATVTACPYKGTARYWSVRTDDALHADLAWSYPEPVVECPRIDGLVAFFNERVDLEIDGHLQRRPRTPWSRGA